jgi:hypothetical protein
MGVGTYSRKCNASDDAYLPENHVALDHRDIRSSRKSRGEIRSIQGMLLCYAERAMMTQVLWGKIK